MNSCLELTEEHLRANPLPVHENGAGKEARGRVLIISGNARVPGAAILAGVSALRAGAGILQIAASASVAPHIGVALPEAMVVGFTETPQGEISASNSDDILALAEGADAIVVGPGMMEEDAVRPLVTSLLAKKGNSRIVMDAAALTCLTASEFCNGAGTSRAIITPHAGEMARFLGIERAAVEQAPLEAAKQAAALSRCVVVMKGADTFIVGEDIWRASFGSIALATSGSGDVLAGILGGLLARGTERTTLAALWAVYLHGEAGRRLGLKLGNVGALARELPHEIPGLMASFEETTP